MAEGTASGAPEISGIEKASHFYHQPPPVEGLRIRSRERCNSRPNEEDIHDPRASPAEEAGPPEIELDSPHSYPPSSPTRPNPIHKTPRAHFPDEPHVLEHKISAPQPILSTRSESSGERDRDPARHRGLWQSIRDWWEDLRDDIGSTERHQEITNLIGDPGIDLRTIRKAKSHGRITSLVGSSIMLARPGLGQHTDSTPSSLPSPSGLSSGTLTPNSPSKKFQAGVDPQEVAKALKKLKNKIANSGESRQAKYIQAKSDLAHRRNLVLLMVYAFMAYGAPSHRIEEYTLALFKACDMEGRVNYTVGCTEVCFINPPDPADPMTRSAYTTLVKAQGLDIGACEVAFRVYKQVVHGDVTIEEATDQMISLIESPSFYRPWFIVPFYGLASAFACIWAYNGYWTDMGVAFFLGCIVGFLQIIISARNPLYSNVLEVTAALVTSFGARAFASIGGSDQKYFCFGAVAESSITTILPGYIVLCGALELQAKSITAGSTRLFYAVMYSLLLGYGIDVGAQLWLVIDRNAPSSAVCPRSVDPRWKILLVPSYLVLQAILIRSRPKQIPVQVIFGSAAYTVNYFVSKYATAQVADSASAFTLGILGHLYARSRHAFAFASVVAGVMVLVPSGLSAQGGLISGISTPLFNNGTTNAQQVYEQNLYQSFSVGAQMIQVAVGLSVGLFVSALAVYPLGRKNNALFSF